MSENSVTNWISLLKTGSDEAANRIWERFFASLCQYARTKLGHARRAQDEEDLAISAIYALCQGAVEQRFRRLENRDDLWQILMMIVARKASNARRRSGFRRETVESDLGRAEDAVLLDHLLASEPTPEFLESIDIQCDALLSQLSDKLREVALLKLAGHSNEEIARIRGRGVSTIERYLQMIRQIWSAEPTAMGKEFCQSKPQSKG